MLLGIYQHASQAFSRLRVPGCGNEYAFTKLGPHHGGGTNRAGKGLKLLGIVLLFVIFLNLIRSFLFPAGYKPNIPPKELHSRQEAVIEAFSHAWEGYSTYCFGHDSLKPVSNTCEDDFGGWGASASDALSTAIIMEKADIVEQVLNFIANLDLRRAATGTKIQVFEVTIRHLGGMVSAWDLLDGPFEHLVKDAGLLEALRAQIVTLGDVLSCSFNAESGIPHDWVDPRLCETDSGTSTSTAGVGTMILEFARLSAITGNETYARLAERAEEYLLNPQTGEAFPGLLGSHVSISSGNLMDASGSWGAFADSFYEYLIKAYIYDSKSYSHYLDRWLIAVDSTIQNIGSNPYGHPELTFLSTWSGTDTTKKMETLSWFAGGNIILGGMVTKNQTLVDYGLSIADAAGAVYQMTATGLGGEFVTWTSDCESDWGNDCNENNSIRTTDARYNMRPEVLETWYHAYRATKNPKYRNWAWSAFTSVNTFCRTDSGFSAITDVNAVDGGHKTDKQESFLYAEVLKYVYLIHLEDRDVPCHVQDSRRGGLNEWVFNTEAHPMRVQGPGV